MTQKDGSPEASEGPYWSEELLAVLVVGLGDETQARETHNYFFLLLWDRENRDCPVLVLANIG